MNNSFNIIICSSSDILNRKTIEFLEEKKYSIFSIHSEAELIKLIQSKTIHLIFIELDLKWKDGITLTSEIRRMKDIEQPFIILFSDKQDDYIQITAFNANVDDFITTPVNPILLEAKISAFKKRYYQNAPELSKDDEKSRFTIDKDTYMITNKCKQISLPRKEFEMVYLMYQNANKVFTRQDFARLIWNMPEVAMSRTIDTHIRNIRRILGNDIIKTSRGIGYTINQELL